MKNLGSFTVLAIIVIAFIAIYLSLIRVDKYLRIKAVDDCGKISRYEASNKDDGTKVWFPENTIYKNCLKDKGYL